MSHELDKHVKTFTYEISLNMVEHSAATVKICLGSDYFNPDFGPDIHAREMIGEMFKDAIVSCVLRQSEHFASGGKKEDRYYLYLQKKKEAYEKMQESLKLVKQGPVAERKST